MKPFFLDQLEIHQDWYPFFTDNITAELSGIESGLSGNSFTPQSDKVLRFLTVPLKTSKIVILGQDPYPQPGVATGRAFEVGNLKSWSQSFSNISVKNILRAIYRAYTGMIISFGSLREKFDNEFPVLGPPQLFSHWEAEGVMLLNTSFTCEEGQPGSHRASWEAFSRSLLKYINEQNPGLIWFVWGSDAEKITRSLAGIKAIRSFHPMMCFDGSGREFDFLYGKLNCFAETKDIVNWTGFADKNRSCFSPSLF